MKNCSVLVIIDWTTWKPSTNTITAAPRSQPHHQSQRADVIRIINLNSLTISQMTQSESTNSHGTFHYISLNKLSRGIISSENNAFSAILLMMESSSESGNEGNIAANVVVASAAANSASRLLITAGVGRLLPLRVGCDKFRMASRISRIFFSFSGP